MIVYLNLGKLIIMTKKKKMILQPGYEWAKCLCKEIHPSDLPCIICEIWMDSGEKPPPEVGALFGKLPKRSRK